MHCDPHDQPAGHAEVRPAPVSAQGVDVLEAVQRQNYVTDDMLLNADKDPNNWLHYGRDYATTRFSPQTQMGGFATSMTPDEIWKVIAFIRSQYRGHPDKQ